MSEPRLGLRRLLASLSLANLLAVPVWVGLFRPGQESPLIGQEFVAAIVAVLLLTTLFWALAQVSSRLPKARGVVAMQAAMLGGLWTLIIWAAVKPGVRQWLQYAAGKAEGQLIVGVGVMIVVILTVLLRKPSRNLQWMTRAALVMSPFVALCFAQAGWQAWHRGLAAPAEVAVAIPRLDAAHPRQRIVALLFDEFDYELAFEPSVRRDPLPALDSLRQQGLFASRAYPPMHSTAMSVPAMLTGRLVRDGKANNEKPGDLWVQFESGANESFAAQTTVFTRLRQVGLNSLRMSEALLPTTRLEGVADADLVVAPAHAPRGLWQRAAAHLGVMFEAVPLLKGRGWSLRLVTWLGGIHPSDDVSRVADQMVDLAGDADVDVLFLHILLPHLPVVYDMARQGFGPPASADYRDNFLAVDQVVERVLQRLKDCGQDGDTTLLIMSDHFYRFKKATYGRGDHRVPFIVRFGADPSPVGPFGAEFNTVLFGDMVFDMATGRIQSSRELADWIPKHARYGESPLLTYRLGW